MNNKDKFIADMTRRKKEGFSQVETRIYLEIMYHNIYSYDTILRLVKAFYKKSKMKFDKSKALMNFKTKMI